MEDYFVMLNTQGGGITPLMNDEEIATFETLSEANDAAKGSVLGEFFGYEVFGRGEGHDEA